MKQHYYDRQHLLIIVIFILMTSSNQLTLPVADYDNANDDDINNNNNSNNDASLNIRYTADERYSVLRLRTKDFDQFLCVKKLIDSSVDLKVNFWKVARDVEDISDVMVPSSTMKKVLQLLSAGNVNVTVTIPDVERLIINREKKNDTFKQQRYRDDPRSTSSVRSVKYDFHSYGSYEKMTKWLRSLAAKHPKFVRYISIGKSHERRSIDGLEVCDSADITSMIMTIGHHDAVAPVHKHRNFQIGGNNRSKRVFWIDGGIHAREWAAPHTALYFIYQLTSKYGRDEQITKYVDELTWVIVPCLNPDGYEFTRSSTDPNTRLWRKNRSSFLCERGMDGRNRCCRGVDLNRNFDFHFKESGSSDDPCAEIYPGKAPFSEPETKAVRDVIMSNRYRSRIDAFVTLHTYSQLWIHPYGHRKDTYPGDIQDLYRVGKEATKALRKLYGTRYIVGSGADTLYPASGGSEDWAKQKAGVKYVYLLELRPDEKNWDGFILEERQLLPTAIETWAGIRVVADAVIERANHKNTRINAKIPSIIIITSFCTIRKIEIESKISHKLQIMRTACSTVNNDKLYCTTKQQYRFGNGSPGSCYDLRHACKEWVRKEESLCQTVPIFMREQCAYSCGHC